ncbi:hypothetical protein ACHAWF_002506 [Thalassiosira exigua]
MLMPIATSVLLLGLGRSTYAASPPPLRVRPEQQLDGETRKRIINGRPLNRRTKPSWLVSIGAEGTHECGASLISERAVLSAAHCFACPEYDRSDPEDVEFYSNCTQGDFFVYPGDTVVLNRTNITESDGDIVYEICKEQGGEGCADLDARAYVVNHPDFAEPFVAPDEFGNGNYNWDIWTNDYSLIILPESRPVPPELTPVALNGDPNLPVDGTPLNAYGWGNNDGLIDGEDFPEVPHVAKVDYVASERCTADPFRYPEGSISETVMCAAAEGKDACNADSGGPLVMETPEGPLEVGLVSFGFVGEHRNSQRPPVHSYIVLRTALNYMPLCAFADDTYRCSSPIFPGGYARISAGYCWIKETACRETGNVGDLCAKSDPACDAEGRELAHYFGRDGNEDGLRSGKEKAKDSAWDLIERKVVA